MACCDRMKDKKVNFISFIVTFVMVWVSQSKRLVSITLYELNYVAFASLLIKGFDHRTANIRWNSLIVHVGLDCIYSVLIYAVRPKRFSTPVHLTLFNF